MPDTEEAGFAPPPFDPDAALQTLKRSLRDLKLTERGARFELRGKPVLEATRDGPILALRVARKLALTPEWDRVRVAQGSQLRSLIDDLKRRLERWERED